MVNITAYDERLDLVALQFRLVRFALGRLPKTQRSKFFRTLKREELSRTTQGLEEMQKFLPGDAEEFEKFKAMHLEWAEKHMRKKFSRRNQRFYDEFIEDGVNASELLIRVAHFEAFMKDIHLEVLHAKPSLLGIIRPSKSVKYEDLFKEGITFSFFQTQEFRREAEEVDRKGIKKRAEYFEQELKLRWCDDATLAFLSEVTEVRNKLSHETPDLPVTKEFLGKASDVLRSIPSSCIYQSEKLYPGRFQ